MALVLFCISSSSSTYHFIVTARVAIVALQHLRTVFFQQLLAGRIEQLGLAIVGAVLLISEFTGVAHSVPDAVAAVVVVDNAGADRGCVVAGDPRRLCVREWV